MYSAYRTRQPNWQMVSNVIDEIDLQLFADGGAGGAAGAAGGNSGDSAGQAPQSAGDNRQNGRKPNPLANTKYGRQQDQAQSAASSDGEPSREEWENLKKGRFAKLYGEDVSNTVRDRLKNSKASDDKLSKLAPILEGMSKKYGVDVNDVDGLMAAYNDDDSLYEEEALEKGISVQTLKSLKKLERGNAEAQAKAEAEQQQAMFAQHLQMLEGQAQELAAEIPGFDLREALQDPRFARMTSPDVGLSVQDAYFAMHHQELMQGMAQTAIKKTKEAVSANIQSGMNRPKEAGTRTAAPGLDVKTDPRALTPADRAEIRRRVRNGEKIYF